ncbi:MAG TPA: hypothetical protein VL693_03260 [Vicinamibacterales bacterium]|nr:hypothetical protein [Vicinamibacterales bacterium]
MPPSLAAWESFYVIVGSSAAALTGLFFVVVALIADLDAPGTPRAIAAFSTPNIVHFCAALLTSATLSAPWPSLAGASIAIGIYGVVGVIYTMDVMRRARKQGDYEPVLEDWLFHVAFPLAAYVAFIAAATMMTRVPLPALFACAAGTIGLVFIGIHNAWDTVTYLAVKYGRGQNDDMGQHHE